MSPTQYAGALIIKSLGCGELYDEYALKGIFIEDLYRQVRHSTRAYLSTSPAATLYNRAVHTTSVQAREEGTDVQSERESNHCQNTKYSRGRRGNSSAMTNFVKMGGGTLTSMEITPTIAAALMQIRSIPQSISTRSTPSTNWTNATYFNSSRFCNVCLENSHRQVQCPFLSNKLLEQFALQRENNLKTCHQDPRQGSGTTRKACQVVDRTRFPYNKA